MSRRLAWPLLGLVLAASPPAAAIETIPYPTLDNLEAPIRAQVEREREVLDSLLAGDASPADLVAAYGAMGQLYFLYDLAEPAAACFRNATELDGQDFRWPYYLGVVAQMEGDLETARQRLGRAHELAPDDAPTLVRLGQAELEAGDPVAARRSFERLLASDPTHVAALYGLGRVEFSEGRAAKAVELLTAAVEAQPGATSIYHQLGLAYRELGDLEAARTNMARNTHGPVLFADPLVEDLTDLVQGGGLHLKLGNEAMERGEIEVAVREYRAAVEGNPGSALARFNLGTALTAAGQVEAAAAAFLEAIAIDEEYGNAHYNLGTLYARQGRFDLAAAHFESAYRSDPDDHDAHLDWAVALARSGRVEAAVGELERLVEADPSNVSALDNLATAWLNTGKAGAESERLEARRAAETADGLDLYLLAALYERSGRSELALARYRQASEAMPELAAAHSALARVATHSGDQATAAAAYARARELDPSDTEALLGQATALLRGGEHDAARVLLRTELASDPSRIEVAHLLARLLATCPDDSIRSGERALGLSLEIFKQRRSVEHGETVAMALAETGRFEDAAEWQRRVLSLAESEGVPTQVLASVRERLAGYERGEVSRSPWLEQR